MPIPENMLIHIGYPKSGSTYLQDVIFNHPSVHLLKQPDIDYLATSPSFSPDILRQSLAQARPSNPNHALTIFSQEKLSGSLNGEHPERTTQIADRLHAAYPDARVLIITRNQIEYTMSLYCWRVVQRGFETRDLHTYLHDIFETQLRKKLCYDALITYYTNLFGADKVKTLPFELVKSDGTRFTQELAAFTGIPLNRSPSTRRVNVTQRSKALINWSRRVNRMVGSSLGLIRPVTSDADFKRCNQKAIGFKRRMLLPMGFRIAEKHPTALTFPDAWRQTYADAFASSNRKLQDQTGIALADLGYFV
jgi:hypothetical protein